MNNFNKKNFAGQNFGQQRVAAENVAECATETVTTEVAEVANKSGILNSKNIKIAGIVLGSAVVIGTAWYGYKRFFGGKKKAAETTTADPDFEEAK